MNRVMNWLANKILADSKPPEPPLWQTATRPKPRPKTIEAAPAVEDHVEYTGDVGGRIADGGPGKNVLVRSDYLLEHSGEYESLRIVGELGLTPEEEANTDPYNSGRFDRSRSWDKYRSRK